MLLREKMSVVLAGRRGKGKKKDMLEYERDDFELLELQALKEMFQIQFRKFADTGRGERLLKVKYDVNRIIDDVSSYLLFVAFDSSFFLVISNLNFIITSKSFAWITRTSSLCSCA